VNDSKNLLNFFVFDIGNKNQKMKKLKSKMKSGSYEQAADIAREIRGGSNTLPREEIIVCFIAEALECIKYNNFQSALISLGSAHGLSQSLMRLKIELMLAVVNKLDGNEKEAKRKLKEIGSIILLKEVLGPSDALKTLRFEYDSVRVWFDKNRATTVADNEQPIERTNVFFDFGFPVN